MIISTGTLNIPTILNPSLDPLDPWGTLSTQGDPRPILDGTRPVAQ